MRETHAERNKNDEKLSRSRAQRIVRAKRLLKKFEEQHPGEDLLVHMLTDVYKNYTEYVKSENCYNKYASFVFEVRAHVLFIDLFLTL